MKRLYSRIVLFFANNTFWEEVVFTFYLTQCRVNLKQWFSSFCSYLTLEYGSIIHTESTVETTQLFHVLNWTIAVLIVNKNPQDYFCMHTF